VRAVATQAAHLVDTGGHSLVETVASAVRNSWQQHAVRAAHHGRKTRVSCYRTAVMAYCAWAAEKYGDKAVVLPVSRTAAVTFRRPSACVACCPASGGTAKRTLRAAGAPAARRTGKNRRADGAGGRATSMRRGRGRRAEEGCWWEKGLRAAAPTLMDGAEQPPPGRAARCGRARGRQRPLRRAVLVRTSGLRRRPAVQEAHATRGLQRVGRGPLVGRRSGRRRF